MNSYTSYIEIGTYPYFYKVNHCWPPYDVRWDLFSFSVIAYEMLCSSNEFRVDHQDKQFYWDTIQSAYQFDKENEWHDTIEDLAHYGMIPNADNQMI